MSMTVHVDIVSAEFLVYSGSAAMVFAPAVMGEVGILPQHSPFLSKLVPGEVRVRNLNGEEDFFYVSGGLLEVQPHVVTILADTALRAKDLDEARALEAKERALQLIKDRKSDIDYARIHAELLEAIAQLKTIQSLRKKLKGRI
ncbi:ATP synthase F1 complex subunit epsilon [Gammaproteobacteria bacterium]